MELKESMMKRRSVRHFEDKEVSKEIIRELVEHASFAPSWKNSQVARYYAVVDSRAKTKIAESMPEFNQAAVREAAVVMVSTVVTKRSGYNREGIPDTNKGDGWEMYDCGLSNMLFCLEATEKGLGTVIMGYYDEEAVAESIGMPVSERVVAVIALGYPAAVPQMPPRKTAEQLLKFI